jgi:hypothetical protein
MAQSFGRLEASIRSVTNDNQDIFGHGILHLREKAGMPRAGHRDEWPMMILGAYAPMPNRLFLSFLQEGTEETPPWERGSSRACID